MVVACQRGDEAALNALASTCLRKSYHWAFAQSQSADEAEDIAQDVAIRVVQAIGSFRFESQFSTWLFRLTRRTLADRIRTRRRRARLFAKSDVTVQASAPPALVALAAFVRERLGSLPSRQREIFDLVDVQGLSSSEAAALLGLAEPTVRVHLLRARRTLRQSVINERHYTLNEVTSGMR